MARKGLWPTPRAMMARAKVHRSTARSRQNNVNLEEAVGEESSANGYLNPRWIEWLMGLPDGWCDLS